MAELAKSVLAVLLDDEYIRQDEDCIVVWNAVSGTKYDVFLVKGAAASESQELEDRINRELHRVWKF